MIQRSVTIDVVLTPKELALEFSNMDAKQQAIFFSELARVVEKEWEYPFCSQLQYLTDRSELTGAGREVMRQIGMYADD